MIPRRDNGVMGNLEWLDWKWEWDEDNFWLTAIDPDDEDCGHIVLELAGQPDEATLKVLLSGEFKILLRASYGR